MQPTFLLYLRQNLTVNLKSPRETTFILVLNFSPPAPFAFCYFDGLRFIRLFASRLVSGLCYFTLHPVASAASQTRS